MSKRKSRKIDLDDVFATISERTLIRPEKISIVLENRGKDYKLEYKETFKNKQPSENQEWTINWTLSALEELQQRLSRYRKYFYYQVKAIKKGYEVMIVSDDSFALIAGILAELLAFGVREKEDAFCASPLLESLLKWISKVNIADE